ncbi:lipase family protein [Rheinheimera nanhaiensis]|uniref:Uncharacterized protein n=1 Tax=Rheinheimera nanhaiensis E407-8 TaxID=562729 RepID=I1DVP7_9GAMM|nr:hypothetical protein [Rheinheimera nanhaiensis]GAB58125.1 hypothetical protein RNAN_1096 [Rheinheimera nanhaiensis E407-8]
MASVLDLAKCCSAVYEIAPSVLDLRLIEEYNRISHGFYAALFKKGDTAIFAVRGTDDVRYDIPNDIAIFSGSMPTQYRPARDALRLAIAQAKVTNENFIVTGHSLGGGLAALLSAKHNTPLPLVTFNAPGMLRAATASNFGLIGNLINRVRLSGYRNDFKKVLHIRSEHDAVSVGTGARIAGSTRTLANNQCGNISLAGRVSPALGVTQAGQRALCAHSMEGLVKLIAAEPEFTQPISWG